MTEYPKGRDPYADDGTGQEQGATAAAILHHTCGEHPGKTVEAYFTVASLVPQEQCASRPVALASACSLDSQSHLLPLFTQPVDSKPDDVAGAEVDRRFLAKANAGWCTCRDYVAWVQRHELT